MKLYLIVLWSTGVPLDGNKRLPNIYINNPVDWVLHESTGSKLKDQTFVSLLKHIEIEAFLIELLLIPC